jgi:FkbM family methyltransferase
VVQIRKDRHFILRALRRLNILQYCNLHPKVELNGKTFKLPILKGIGYENLSQSEPWLDNLLLELFALTDGAFVDVGVNVGQTLLKFLEHSNGQMYYGFEPNCRCAAYAIEFTELNNLKMVHIVPAGLSDSTGMRTLFLGSDYDSCGSMIDGFRVPEFYKKSEHISVMLGDDVFEMLKVGDLGVMKIDVEGAEWEVLSGLRRTLAMCQPFIICELLPIYEEETTIGRMRRRRLDQVLDLLGTLSYEFCRVGDDGAQWLDTVETHADLSKCNYLFVPRVHSQTLRARLSAATSTN